MAPSPGLPLCAEASPRTRSAAILADSRGEIPPRRWLRARTFATLHCVALPRAYPGPLATAAQLPPPRKEGPATRALELCPPRQELPADTRALQPRGRLGQSFGSRSEHHYPPNSRPHPSAQRPPALGEPLPIRMTWGIPRESGIQKAHTRNPAQYSQTRLRRRRQGAVIVGRHRACPGRGRGGLPGAAALGAGAQQPPRRRLAQPPGSRAPLRVGGAPRRCAHLTGGPPRRRPPRFGCRPRAARERRLLGSARAPLGLGCGVSGSRRLGSRAGFPPAPAAGRACTRLRPLLLQPPPMLSPGLAQSPGVELHARTHSLPAPSPAPCLPPPAPPAARAPSAYSPAHTRFPLTLARVHTRALTPEQGVGKGTLDRIWEGERPEDGDSPPQPRRPHLPCRPQGKARNPGAKRRAAELAP